MTRAEQLGLANEIAVLCGIIEGYLSSFCPPSDARRQLQAVLDVASAQFLDLTDELVEDGSPRELGLCPACGEEVAPPSPQPLITTD